VRKEFSTVEWRAPDTALPSQVAKLAGDVSRLVAQTAAKPVEIGDPGIGPRRIRVPPFEDLADLTTAAIEHGLDSPAVWTYLEGMSIDPREYRPISAEIERRSSISVPEARRIRLEYADRLEDDVETLLDGTELRRSRSVSTEGSRATADRLKSW
jgi:hypothetical protein